MKSSTPGIGRAARGVDESARQLPTEALPAAEPTALISWPFGARPEAGAAAAEPGVLADPDAAAEAPALPGADEEPFIPKSRYVLGRSTKVLVCLVLVAAGMFGGSVIQKQIDAGTRASRSTFGTVQGPGAGTGSSSGTQSPAPRRRGGAAGGGAAEGGAAGGVGSSAPTAVPSVAAGK
ncbi:hypothetical protein [Arthrobacter sp. UYEF3]|uniref:hypothetical protein n=1 Tax=Arthrobacter sp. UYEF3 TaxID=1756365 RepID=UPI00339AA9C3